MKEDAFDQFNAAIDNISSSGSGPLLDSQELEAYNNGDWSLEDDEDPDAPKIVGKTGIFEGQVVQVEQAVKGDAFMK